MQIVKYCASSHLKAFRLACENVKKGKNAGIKSIFVVPDNCGENVKNSMVKALVDGASFNVDILSFSELLSLSSCDKNFKFTAKTDGRFFVKKILTENENNLKCFASTKKTLTFSSMIYDVISDFKKNGVTVDRLKKEISTIADERQRNKFSDLCFVYEMYEKFLNENNFVDEVDCVKIATTFINQSAKFENTNFCFCFFNNFYQYQIEMIEALAFKCNEISFCIAEPKQHQPNSEIYSTKISKQIENISKKIGKKCEIISNYDEKNEIIKQINENLFTLSTDIKPLNVNGEIVLMNAANIANEVSYVAKRISWLIKNGLCRYNDILICVPDLNLYQPFIEQTFKKLQLSFWIDCGVPLEKTQCFKFVVDTINCIRNDFMASDVLSVVYNPCFGFEKDKIEFIETMTSKYGIDHKMWLTPLKNEKGGENFKLFEQEKQEIVAPILLFKKELDNAKTLSNYCGAIVNFLNSVNAKDNLQNCKIKLQDFSKENNIVLQQSFDKLLKVFEDVSKNVADFEISFTDFFAFLTNIIGKKPIPKTAKTLDSVFVGKVDAVKYLECKYLFVFGANEGVFPSSQSDVGIVSDNDKRNMDCLKEMATVTERNIESKFAVMQALLVGQELMICYPTKGLSEKLMPSGVINSLQNLFSFAGAPLPVVKTEQLLDDDRSFGSAEEKICFNIASYENALEYVAENDLPGNARDLIVSLFEQKGINVKGCLEDNQIENYIKNAKELFFPKGSTKVTQLENYFSCPFKHFLVNGLKLFEKEQSQIKATEIGTVLHGVAEEFVKKYEKKSLKKDEIIEISSKIFAKVIGKPEFEHLLLDKKNETILKGLKKESGNICLAIHYQNSHSKFETKFCEASFGDAGFAKMAEFDVNGTKLLLSGKVDRVDMFENYVRVVDYKTGKASSEYKESDLYYGKKVQLFVYMWAILNGMKQTKLQPAGVFLMPLHNELTKDKDENGFLKYRLNGTTLNEEKILRAQDDQVGGEHTTSDIIKFTIKKNDDKNAPFVLSGKGNGGLVSVEKFNKMLDYSIKISSKAILEILSGFIKAKPYNGACAFCKAKGLCEFYKQVTGKIRKFDLKIEDNSFEGEEDAKDKATTCSNQ